MGRRSASSPVLRPSWVVCRSRALSRPRRRHWRRANKRSFFRMRRKEIFGEEQIAKWLSFSSRRVLVTYCFSWTTFNQLLFYWLLKSEFWNWPPTKISQIPFPCISLLNSQIPFNTVALLATKFEILWKGRRENSILAAPFSRGGESWHEGDRPWIDHGTEEAKATIFVEFVWKLEISTNSKVSFLFRKTLPFASGSKAYAINAF